MLKEMQTMVQDLAEDRSSELATQFHDIAIAQAKPASPPKDEGKSAWEYDSSVDRYIPV